MNRGWLVFVSKHRRVWIGPELYLERRFVERETRRWATALSGRHWDRAPRLPLSLRNNVVLHRVETEFLPPWRACPLWLGVRWSSQSFPRLKAELMAADADEAQAWVSRYARAEAVDAGADPEVRFEATRIARGAERYVAAHRVKRFSGF
jgi:hypothetical protein